MNMNLFGTIYLPATSTANKILGRDQGPLLVCRPSAGLCGFVAEGNLVAGEGSSHSHV